MSSAVFASYGRIKVRSTWMRSSPVATTSREVLPANPVGRLADSPLPDWFESLSSRVEELSRLPDDWDSYGARALHPEAAIVLSEFLRDYAFAIQSPPVISLDDEGGLIAEWQTPLSSLELVANPGAEVIVYYHDANSNREWELPVSYCDMLEKWLWRASSRV